MYDVTDPEVKEFLDSINKPSTRSSYKADAFLAPFTVVNSVLISKTFGQDVQIRHFNISKMAEV